MTMNIDKFVIKKYETSPLKEIADAPIYAIAGISENGAKLLNEALPNINIKTVRDLANLKFVKWAQAICTLADGEN
ncbi:MAG: hypothetical protein LBH44_13025 [Treponema sp.]|jgi:predicted ABC-class ATPase|nr:hypothetical protein [Treponema sp.]